MTSPSGSGSQGASDGGAGRSTGGSGGRLGAAAGGTGAAARGGVVGRAGGPRSGSVDGRSGPSGGRVPTSDGERETPAGTLGAVATRDGAAATAGERGEVGGGASVGLTVRGRVPRSLDGPSVLMDGRIDRSVPPERALVTVSVSRYDGSSLSYSWRVMVIWLPNISSTLRTSVGAVTSAACGGPMSITSAGSVVSGLSGSKGSPRSQRPISFWIAA